MAALVGGLVLGGGMVVFAILSRLDRIPRHPDREGIFDGGYTFWVAGLAVMLFGVGQFALERGASEDLGGLIGLVAIVLGLYGAWCIVRSPRWMWPSWRHELERRQQAGGADEDVNP